MLYNVFGLLAYLK